MMALRKNLRSWDAILRRRPNNTYTISAYDWTVLLTEYKLLYYYAIHTDHFVPAEVIAFMRASFFAGMMTLSVF